ncbi:Rne/Rng family ribonuclease [Litorivicinus lipolyticus]|uniref:Rne/Rng family ribonuclease n=1 Tax=Litorivicinus lipolyticus TaxID=418701 RepID=UPI003B5B1315
MKRMLINATQSEELRVALVDGQKLFDLDIESTAREQKKGNIYRARITRVEPSLEAAFVEFGSERQGFLPLKEISSEYYNKPVDQIQGRPRIEELVKEGTELLVQVEKEERGTKGAALTTYLSLAGRYMVLMPNNPRAGGISRRIEGEDRGQLKEALSALEIPKGMGVIIRTAGVGRTSEELQWDLDYLCQAFETIKQATLTKRAPCLIYQEGDIITRAIRDYLKADINEVLIDNPEVFTRAKDFVASVMPSFASKIRQYTDDIPLFNRYQIESQIESAFEREVKLPSGGSLVIDPTEALVSIDINSARATKGNDIEATALNTNLEAAEEIARQLRLRDMGGLVVIDFIDMSPAKNRRAVEERMRDSLRHDRARVQIGSISRFGLMEMSRQRLRPSLGETAGHVCPRCLGTGYIRDLRSLALALLRLIEEEGGKDKTGEVRAHVPVDIATFLLNEKRAQIRQIENRNRTRVVIVPNPNMQTPQFEVKRLRENEVDMEGFDYEADLPEIEAPSYEPVSKPAAREQAAITSLAPPPPPPPAAEPAAPRAERKTQQERRKNSQPKGPSKTTHAEVVASAPSRGLFSRFISGLTNLLADDEPKIEPVAAPAETEKSDSKKSRNKDEGQGQSRGSNRRRRGPRRDNEPKPQEIVEAGGAVDLNPAAPPSEDESDESQTRRRRRRRRRRSGETTADANAQISNESNANESADIVEDQAQGEAAAPVAAPKRSRTRPVAMSQDDLAPRASRQTHEQRKGDGTEPVVAEAPAVVDMAVETTVAETAVVETAVVETAVVETAVVETAVVETAVVETIVAEPAIAEVEPTVVADTAPVNAAPESEPAEVVADDTNAEDAQAAEKPKRRRRRRRTKAEMEAARAAEAEPVEVVEVPDAVEAAVVAEAPEVVEAAVVADAPEVVEAAVVADAPEVVEAAVVAESPEVVEAAVVADAPEVVEAAVVAESPEVVEAAVVAESPEVVEAAVVAESPEVVEAAVVADAPEVVEAAVVADAPEVVEAAVVAEAPEVVEAAVVADEPTRHTGRAANDPRERRRQRLAAKAAAESGNEADSRARTGDLFEQADGQTKA